MDFRSFPALAAALVLVATPLCGRAETPPAPPAADRAKPERLPPEASARQSLTIAGRKLNYTAHAGALPVKGGRAVETGFKGELSNVAPGKVRSLTLSLKPGKYVLICNLLGHYKAGQYAALRVR